MTWTAYFYLFLFLLSYLFLKLWWRRRKLPPGPFPFPLVGNFPQIGFGIWRGCSLTEILYRWQKSYGDVFTTWIGSMPTVNFSSYELAYEAMVKKGIYFTDRPKLFLFDAMRQGKGILVANGVQWTEQRRFAIHAMKNMGMGKNLMEGRILAEMEHRRNYLNDEIDTHGWELLVDPKELFELTVANIISSMLFSERFTKINEDEFFKLKRKVDQTMEKASIFDFFINEKNVKYPPFRQRMNRILPSSIAMLDFVKERIRERKSQIWLGLSQLKGDGDDFVEAYLLHMEREDTDKELFNEETLAINLMDLWFAGQETTTLTLYWAFAYLLLHENVMRRVEAELDEATGKKRPLHLGDKTQTPYFNATITEILRVANIFPMNLWRVASEDVEIGGYRIRKGTAVTAQLSLLMSNPKLFPDPEKFNPERYFESDGKVLEQNTVAFGMGRRQCLGEALARAEIYLILGNLLLWYDICPDPHNMPAMRAGREIGGFRRPKSYKMVIRRKKQWS